MRFPRVKAEGQSFYHCVSTVVDRQFIFQTTGHGSPEAERFVLLMRRLEAFSLTHSTLINAERLAELYFRRRAREALNQPYLRAIRVSQID